MGRPIVDLTGMRFTRLVVLRQDGFIGRNAAWLCRCDCGKEKKLIGGNLKHGTQSCGCLGAERASARVKAHSPRLKHGLSKTDTYTCWSGMVSRCCNERDSNYPRYGGRGITVCKRWSDPENGFDNFLADMGHRPSRAHSIDRKDGELGYEPGNCRWATRSQQNRNVGLKRSNKSGFKGVTETPHGWVAEIRSDGGRVGLGSYRSAKAAALAYNIASERLHGEFGVRNPLPPISVKMTKIVFRRVKKKIKAALNRGDKE